MEKSQIGLNSENKPETGLSMCSGSIVRLSIPAFRAGDPGPNPGRSTILARALLGFRSLEPTKTKPYWNRPSTPTNVKYGLCRKWKR